MTQHLTTVTIAALSSMLLWGAPVSAMGFSAVAAETAATIDQSAIIKVHSRRSAHDLLHNYGYDRVRYRSRRIGYDGKPIYKFRACMGRKAYHINVDWYGEIVGRHRAGWCSRSYY